MSFNKNQAKNIKYTEPKKREKSNSDESLSYLQIVALIVFGPHRFT